MPEAPTRKRPPPAEVPHLLTRTDVAAILRISTRWLDSMVSARRFPEPDVSLLRGGRWKQTTVNNWIETQGKENSHV